MAKLADSPTRSVVVPTLTGTAAVQDSSRDGRALFVRLDSRGQWAGGHFTLDDARALVTAISDVIEAQTPPPFAVGDFVRIKVGGASGTYGRVREINADGSVGVDLGNADGFPLRYELDEIEVVA